MSITVGAALKKVAVALLSEPNTLKKLGTAVLVVLVAVILPTAMVVALFSGGFEVDTGLLVEYVQNNLTDEQIRLLTQVENIMTEIETP